MTVTFPAALSDPALFGPWFAGPSWDPWKIIIKAAFAVKLTRAERKIFHAVAGRDPPRKPVRELWVIAGRRAGKDSIASAIAAWYAAFVDYDRLLRPGEAASIMCLAVDKTQAKIVLRYTKALFDRVELLHGLVTRETNEGLEISTGAELSVMTSNFRSVRGRSIACAVLDECAFWRSEESASPDSEVYSALIPGLATIPGAMLLGLSSPYRKSGLLYQKWKDHYGREDDDTLVIQAPSRVLNPTIEQKLVDRYMATDPAVARAEWLGEFRADISGFVDREILEAAVDTGVMVRPRVPGVRYVAGCDPSGGAADSFTAAVAHAEGEAVVVDCLIEIKAPFNPTAATKQITDVIKAYGLTECVGDRYSAGWVVDAFQKIGVAYVHSERDRSAIYSDALPLFTAGRARLLDNAKLIVQFANLERKTSPSGRDHIDHPKGQNDDLANSVALAMVLATKKSSGFDLDLYVRAFGDEAPAPSRLSRMLGL